MNLIYSCVFFKEQYITLMNMLLYSYVTYGNPKEDTHYLIMCNVEFEIRIKQIIDNLNINGDIWCLNMNTLFEAGYSRLKIFEYPSIDSYNKILYLDCDILITNNLSNILNFELENKLYALEEGKTNEEYWGSMFFDKSFNHVNGFTSGILLFNNCITIKKLFNDVLYHINFHIKTKKQITTCLDQPFIVYHAISKNLYNNQKLKNIVINNPKEYKNETISHFPGGPGNYQSKSIKMCNYLNYIKNKFEKI
jgi:lipopolysaccharide biosynthesis glycosyltransferase